MGKKLFIEDFEGRRFSSVAEMCAFYGIEKSTYLRRLQRGWSQEEALMKPVRTSPLKSSLSEKERQSIYYKKYYAKNKARENERVRAYRDTHKEQIKAQTKEYREKNQDWIREYQKAYRNNPKNKAKAREYQKAYREKKLKEKMGVL